MCALRDTGLVRCWGNDSQQQLGDGSADTVNMDTPSLVA